MQRCLAGMLPSKKRAPRCSSPVTRGLFRLERSGFFPKVCIRQELTALPLAHFSDSRAFSLFPLGTNTLNGAIVPSSGLVLNPALPNGMTIFPGGFPLYRNGVLIGAIGVSGDGIDQDHIIAASGTVNFLAATDIRADHFLFRATRLPYAKFPRNPSL